MYVRRYVYIHIIKCHEMSFYNIYVYIVTILVSLLANVCFICVYAVSSTLFLCDVYKRSCCLYYDVQRLTHVGKYAPFDMHIHSVYFYVTYG